MLLTPVLVDGILFYFFWVTTEKDLHLTVISLE